MLKCLNLVVMAETLDSFAYRSTNGEAHQGGPCIYYFGISSIASLHIDIRQWRKAYGSLQYLV
uniref:Uncharacterized protein n=1 Tax=Arundo donax TaxID=35708 RepID=A0A0A9FM45_ARUDO